MRKLARDRLTLLVKERAACWRQQGKFNNIIEGDASTKYFHAHASSKLRHNQIRVVECNGTRIMDQTGKSATFTDYYTALLGSEILASWQFDLSVTLSEGVAQLIQICLPALSL